jgi:hypothetical protein
MRYWWVNQNQIYRHEVEGGYLWSPKRNATGPVTWSSRSWTHVSAQSASHSGIAGKALNRQNSGLQAKTGRTSVAFTRLDNQVRPKDHIDILRSLLRDRYSPLQPNGNGLQSIHLTELPQPFAETLIALIGGEADRPSSAPPTNCPPLLTILTAGKVS